MGKRNRGAADDAAESKEQTEASAETTSAALAESAVNDGASDAPVDRDDFSPPAPQPTNDTGGGDTTTPAPPPSADAGAAAPSQPPPPVTDKDDGEKGEVVFVEVTVDNLGPQLLRRGNITSDPKIVALLDDGSGRVRLHSVVPPSGAEGE